MITLEQIAKHAQKYTERRPVFILGCGTSIPHGLPSMEELADSIISKVDSKGEEWTKFKTKLSELNNLEQALQAVDLSETQLENVIRQTWELTSKKDKIVFNDLLSSIKSLPLTALFQHFLRTANPQIHVITTNYDRLAEYAADKADAKITTGFTSGWIQRFVACGLEKRIISKTIRYQGNVNILKVHGSLDWFLSPLKQPVGIPLVPKIPKDYLPLIITPGNTKYHEVLTKEPFRSVLLQTDQIINAASCFLCIGYGFNDDHVQPQIINRVFNSKIPIVILTKELTPSACNIFLNKPPEKYLFLSEHEQGTLVHCLECPSGEIIEDKSLWRIDDFTKLITNEVGEIE